MNALPRLLRLLETAASARDKRGLQLAFEQLDANTGWNSSVADFVHRLPPRDRQFVHAFRLSTKRSRA